MQEYYFSSLPRTSCIGQFARLLLTVVTVAISQAPSPESNPNPPLPVSGKVVHYTTFNLIGGEFVQRRTVNRVAPTRRFRYIGLRQQLHLPTGVSAWVFVPAMCIPNPTRR